MVSIIIAPIPDIEEINGNLYGVLTNDKTSNTTIISSKKINRSLVTDTKLSIVILY